MWNLALRVALISGGAMAAHLIAGRLARLARLDREQTHLATLALIVCGGLAAAWNQADGQALITRAGAIGWFVSAMIVYAELRSLLSRGYSLCVLVDILHAQRRPSMAELADSYGRGLGLSGMMAKRIASLASLRLVQSRDGMVGPLTPLGRSLARFGRAFRRVLRLELVG